VLGAAVLDGGSPFVFVNPVELVAFCSVGGCTRLAFCLQRRVSL
jgi:hypothetical protein